ncbi:DUF938 domain-containing protein [Sphingopyxis sp.]|uniref:DUF938 domain-containing protein n=1 Tax=Sphingopyxis sp. TaxID=1908224 RepID=UPI003A0FFB09
MPADGGAAAKRHAPATLRNRDAIAAVLAEWLPETGMVLEVASGSGEHIVHFASIFPDLNWQPSDPDRDALTSIAAWSAEGNADESFEGGCRANLLSPLALDASASEWPVTRADALLCINMVHISPWAATLGLFSGAARLLSSGAPLILYGAYFDAAVPTAESNLSFDANLRERNPEWGLRDLGEVKQAAAASALRFCERRVMPANNLMLLFRRD